MIAWRDPLADETLSTECRNGRAKPTRSRAKTTIRRRFGEKFWFIGKEGEVYHLIIMTAIGTSQLFVPRELKMDARARSTTSSQESPHLD